MSSEACIHPACGCKSYKDPGHPKGTLLLMMRLGCKGCGHPGSEHRGLTAVDRLVREEVERVAAVRCSHLIPLNEIPYSPVFRPHDPIPIPYDSDEASGVPCTCPGFLVASLVRLWQNFRTYSLSTAVSLLPTVTCSTCGHTLQDHQPRPGGDTSDGVATPINFRQEGEREMLEELSGVRNPRLTLKMSTKLALKLLRGCVQVLAANEEEREKLTVVGLHSPSEGEVDVVVSFVKLAVGERGKEVTCEEEGEDIGNGLRGEASAAGNVRDSAGKELETEEDTNSHPQEISEPKKGRGRGRKRRRCVNLLPARKSARLKNLAGKGREGGGKEEAEARRREEERGRRLREVERVRGQHRALCGRVVEFVSSLEDGTSFTHYPLPEEICRCGVEMMAVTRAGGGLVLGLGTASGQVFVAAITTAGNLAWLTVDSDTSSKCKVKSLSWMVKTPSKLCLAAGYGGGSVTVWRLDLNLAHSEFDQSVVSRLQDTRADITLTSWAPDERVLVAGSLDGEVLFYLSSPEEGGGHQLTQRLRCGGSAITCAAWMSNSSLLAVGGTDDSIHMLQRKQSHSTGRPANSQSSLFSYFKPVDADTFIYTQWLRGHCSFVSSLLSLGSTTLLSLGWDCHMLFWQGMEPMRLTNREILPIEDGLPQSGFKLGPSTTTEYLPLSLCAVAGFGVLVLFTNRTRDVDLTYYTFPPIPTS